MLDHTSVKPNIWVINEVFGAADEEFAVSGARRLASTNFFCKCSKQVVDRSLTPSS
jgi:hypothetical protein